MSLTANALNVYESQPNPTNSHPVAASAEIFKGSAVSFNAGYARKLTAGDVFAGFAEQHINNSSGAAGDLWVPVRKSGVIQAAITGAAVTDINKAVYMSDENTFTTSSGGSAVLIGRIIRFVSTGVVMVEFNVTVQSAS
jgi:hypothetical protein